MKKQFMREAHSRQDKARKPEYTGGGWSAPTATWTGLDEQFNEKVRRHLELRKTERKKLRSLYYVYGKWLYRPSEGLWEFYKLNAAHVKSPCDPELAPAFKQCCRNWYSDVSKLASEIERAPISIKQLPGHGYVEHLEWRLPEGLIADEIWWEIPPAFVPKDLQQQQPTTPQKIEVDARELHIATGAPIEECRKLLEKYAGRTIKGKRPLPTDVGDKRRHNSQ
jgi:hypothetical protein